MILGAGRRRQARELENATQASTDSSDVRSDDGEPAQELTQESEEEEFPKLGHIMTTQPGSQPREQVMPSDEQLTMQKYVEAMVDRD